ncbi:MAG: hypothetical protein BWY76_00403 [bacterium ADurb.Bin429]|nr:MAG: hypothetical protein BWY76_00403 [bacterium ADurb.Bin429]
MLLLRLLDVRVDAHGVVLGVGVLSHPQSQRRFHAHGERTEEIGAAPQRGEVIAGGELAERRHRARGLRTVGFRLVGNGIAQRQPKGKGGGILHHQRDQVLRAQREDVLVLAARHERLRPAQQEQVRHQQQRQQGVNADAKPEQRRPQRRRQQAQPAGRHPDHRQHTRSHRVSSPDCIFRADRKVPCRRISRVRQGDNVAEQ